jgi:hypothetical protein
LWVKTFHSPSTAGPHQPSDIATLPAGKQDDHPACLQVLHRLVAHLQAKFPRVILVREGHGDHEFLDLGDAGQQRCGSGCGNPTGRG